MIIMESLHYLETMKDLGLIQFIRELLTIKKKLKKKKLSFMELNGGKKMLILLEAIMLTEKLFL